MLGDRLHVLLCLPTWDHEQVWEDGEFVAVYRMWRDQMTVTLKLTVCTIVYLCACVCVCMYEQVWENGDFVAGYSVWRDQMTATVYVEPPQPGMPDQRGTFALSVTPPGGGWTLSHNRHMAVT